MRFVQRTLKKSEDLNLHVGKVLCISALNCGIAFFYMARMNKYIGVHER